MSVKIEDRSPDEWKKYYNIVYCMLIMSIRPVRAEPWCMGRLLDFYFIIMVGNNNVATRLLNYKQRSLFWVLKQ